MLKLELLIITGMYVYMDLTGKDVANKHTTNGKVEISLSKGIYIVNTSAGNTKLIVY